MPADDIIDGWSCPVATTVPRGGARRRCACRCHCRRVGVRSLACRCRHRRQILGCAWVPEGVALSGRFPYLRTGDHVRLAIDGLGAVDQRMVDAPATGASE